MKITITGINFNYENGFDQEFTSVDLNFISVGVQYSLSGPVRVSKSDYQAASNNNDQLRSLIKQTVINDLQAE
ncbi:hypothetical protein J6TS1_10640 [Siminovitchia terrae]|uniref:Uncharacterized protein n=1 Tax=Siminovitchia terrae TaxID=1914933 RepID=A0ABQ4KT48_SIMTE|nr:hypothetical protein [Siminovitchia terrae]GIN95194.1 hypothetical protein J6TS1_10640 [Siminovitchia terrae]